MSAVTLFCQALVWFQWLVILYFVILTAIYMALATAGLFEMMRYRSERREHDDADALSGSNLTPPVSILAPAYNEAATIVESVRAMLSLSYSGFEVIVVNDGSKDRTLELLIDEFHLYRSARYVDAQLPTQPVRSIYESMDPIPLVVVDKENGGKADALNAGINAARYPLICCVDSDSVLEQNALLRVVRPVLDDPERTIAVGGIVRIANGCTTRRGRVTRVDLPRSWLARFQVIEYLRAFLGGRVAFSASNCLVIVSGAFGLFNKAAVIAAGGYETYTVGEDMELILRLHSWAQAAGRDYRIVFEPDPVCWTEAPESMEMLRRQRNRWQRGCMETLWRHRGMVFHPRFGMLGLFALPYYVLFECLGPIIECTGYLATVVAAWLRVVDPSVSILFFVAAVLNGVILSGFCVILEELSTRRYPSVKNLAVLLAAAVLENFGFRQLIAFWRAKAIIDLLRGVKAWGAMERKGFNGSALPATERTR